MKHLPAHSPTPQQQAQGPPEVGGGRGGGGLGGGKKAGLIIFLCDKPPPPHRSTMPAHMKDERVKCLASRFDGNSEDNEGRTFSQRHMLSEGTQWCYGTVKRVMKGDNYKVLWDGDHRQYTSHTSHLEPADDDEGDAEDSDEEGGESSEDGGGGGGAWDIAEPEDQGPVVAENWDVVEPAGEDSDGEQGAIEGDDLHDRPEVGDTVEVHEKEWTKAATMGQDARGNKPRQGFIRYDGTSQSWRGGIM